MSTSTTRSDTRHVLSPDGTQIAYETTGAGPALVLVDGALCYREMGPSRDLASALADDFTVYVYDRRGRGESDPGQASYDVVREIEDLRAVIEAAGGSASVVGFSSGGALALEAARTGAPIERIVAYEVPFILDDSHAPNDLDLPDQLQRSVDAGRRGDAVKLFMRTVGAPRAMIAVMPLMPVWKRLTAVAHTLSYDLSIVVPHEQARPLPEGYYSDVRQPTLMLAGGKSPAYLRNAQAAIADAVPGGHVRTLPGQTHMVKAKAVAPVVREFLS